tara:strand:+ start:4766 stop:5233 length:468 start_codon:yes stop_codon:yes gene_type:complete
MDYGDFRKNREASPSERKEGIDKIYDAFKVNSDDMARASQIADIPYPTDIWSYYMIAFAISEGRYFRKEYDDDVDSMEINRPDFAYETAETVIPIQTYVIWSIWIDLGYNVDAYEEIGFSSIEVSDMEKVAQYQLVKIAENILMEFAYGDDDGFR